MDLGDAADSFGSPFSKHHTRVRTDIFGVLDKSETTAGFVSCPQVFPVHGYNGGCLSGTTTVNWIANTRLT